MNSMYLELAQIKRKENQSIKSKDEILKEQITIGRGLSLQINVMEYHEQLYILNGDTGSDKENTDVQRDIESK